MSESARSCTTYWGIGHPLFNRPDEEIDDVVLSTCSYVRKAYTVASTFQEKNDQLRHHVSAFHVEAIAILVLSGAHIGFLPERYAENWVRTGELRAIRPSEWCAEFEFGAVTRKSRSPAAAVEQVSHCRYLSATRGERHIRIVRTRGSQFTRRQVSR
jgi:DNA-binding transcriptional LysR family regulator